MSIDQSPHGIPLVLPPPPAWGEIAAEGRTALVTRFVLTGRVVTYPVSALRRWEQLAGEPELLKITAGKENIIIQGHELAAIRAALDLGRLVEVHPTPSRNGARPGPRVYSITLEATK